MTAPSRFQVALTADFYESTGTLKYSDIGLDLFKTVPEIEISCFKVHQPEILPEQLPGINGVIVLTPVVSAKSLADSAELLSIGRFGVGYDSVDVEACTHADVLLFITTGAVDHSVAEATIGWMLALTHHMRIKDTLVREGRWNERSLYMGSELRDRTLGLVGFGGIARATLKILSGFGMKRALVFDPFVSASVVEEFGAAQVTLETLLGESDFVSIHCPLNAQTRNLLSAPQIALMKPNAYLLNTARGGIVDEGALFAALAENRIAGAALDCFVGEPLTAPSRFASLPNVLLAPHSIAWTNELFREIGRAACQGMIDLARGQIPRGVVNRDVLDRPSFQQKWKRIRGQISRG